MEWKNFTLIGLGLIGGSIAKAIKKAYPRAKISVLEKDQHSVEMAISEGIIEKGLQSIDEIPSDTDLLFLCTPLQSLRLSSFGKCLLSPDSGAGLSYRVYRENEKFPLLHWQHSLCDESGGA